MHVDMVFAHYSFEYPDIFRVADLDEQLSTSELHVSFEHMIPILRRPDQMRRESRDRVAAMPVLFHLGALLTFLEVGSN